MEEETEGVDLVRLTVRGCSLVWKEEGIMSCVPSGTTDGNFDSESQTQLARLDPTEDQIFSMAHVELAYREKQAHVIHIEEHGFANGGEGLEDHIAALCSKPSKDQIAFLGEQYKQFYREATKTELDGEAHSSRIM